MTRTDCINIIHNYSYNCIFINSAHALIARTAYNRLHMHASTMSECMDEPFATSNSVEGSNRTEALACVGSKWNLLNESAIDGDADGET